MDKCTITISFEADPKENKKLLKAITNVVSHLEEVQINVKKHSLGAKLKAQKLKLEKLAAQSIKDARIIKL